MDHGPDEVRRVEALYRTAREAAGLAAYHYFFLTASPESREAYVAAMAAESEAEALLDTVRSMVEASVPPAATP